MGNCPLNAAGQPDLALFIRPKRNDVMKDPKVLPCHFLFVALREA